MKKRWLLSLAGLAGMVCAALAGAQETDKPATFGEAIDVRVVNVEVVVTDRKGDRIPGLGPKDFQLEVDGKPVAVDYFTEVRDGRAAEPAEADATAAPASGFVAGEEVGTNYLVFIDNFFSVALKRNEILETLRRDLARLGPADRMSIVAWDGVRMNRLITWTGSRDALAATLEFAKARPTRGLYQLVRRNQFLRDQKEQERDEQAMEGIDDVLKKVLNTGPTLEELSYARNMALEIGEAVNATVAAMRGSDPPSGRKVLVLLSGGWPFSLDDYIRQGRISLASDLPQTRPMLESLANTANLLGYTIYPVDVPGLTTVTRTADQSGREVLVAGPGSMLETGTPVAQPFVENNFGSFEEHELEGTLEYLARETGGRPLLNGNRSRALTAPAADTRSYYWLGFSPAWSRDGKGHKLSVKVLRPGLQARTRKGFLDLSREAEIGLKVESAILFGEVGNAQPLAVHAGAPKPTKQKGLVSIPVTLEIPAESLTLLPSGNGYAARAVLRLAAADDAGNRSEIPRVDIRLDADKMPAPGQTLRYETNALLRGKASRIVAIVYDPLTGRIVSGETPLQAPSR